MSQPHLIALFENVNIGMGQVGLCKLARQHRRNPDTLDSNAWLVFINRAGNKMKFLAPGGETLVYYRTKTERRITREAIQALPGLFGSTHQFTWNDAIERAFERMLVRGDTRPRLRVVA